MNERQICCRDINSVEMLITAERRRRSPLSAIIRFRSAVRVRGRLSLARPVPRAQRRAYWLRRIHA